MEKADILLYKKIDNILWNDWDPIGINDVAPRDEYQRYIPEIFNLKKSGASREEIVNQLYKFESEQIAMETSLEHRLFVADKIINIV